MKEVSPSHLVQKIIRKIFRFQFNVFEMIENCFCQFFLLFIGGKVLCLKNKFAACKTENEVNVYFVLSSLAWSQLCMDSFEHSLDAFISKI